MRPISPFPVSLPPVPLPLVCCRGKKRARTGHHRKSAQHDHHHARTARPGAGAAPHAIGTRRGSGPEHPASQRAQAIKRRKAIWEALHPVETGGKTLSTCLSDGRAAGPQHEQGFAASTAAAAGMTKQAINQHLARAEALGDDLPRVTGTSLDKGVELDF